eukprot:gnl/MRDRNA2_/MRDRNA2_210425_c0_seq1.p1 gnl/MRDRNA2_/MRDRNA2_210425_c0~~gnl/MRDRNA2_/MRDRNA2_210425_c0_seq1.p1  ORF type:complete len:140 (-),score=17.25 gnl/MRDRNA2_/MRDRNA2_210425_c0_seq1:211-630(-)
MVKFSPFESCQSNCSELQPDGSQGPSLDVPPELRRDEQVMEGYEKIIPNDRQKHDPFRDEEIISSDGQAHGSFIKQENQYHPLSGCLGVEECCGDRAKFEEKASRNSRSLSPRLPHAGKFCRKKLPSSFKLAYKPELRH